MEIERDSRLISPKSRRISRTRVIKNYTDRVISNKADTQRGE